MPENLEQGDLTTTTEAATSEKPQKPLYHDKRYKDAKLASKEERKEADKQRSYVTATNDFYARVNHILVRMPREWERFITGDIHDAARAIVNDVVGANAIYLQQKDKYHPNGLSDEDMVEGLQERIHYLEHALRGFRVFDSAFENLIGNCDIQKTEAQRLRSTMWNVLNGMNYVRSYQVDCAQASRMSAIDSSGVSGEKLEEALDAKVYKNGRLSDGINLSVDGGMDAPKSEDTDTKKDTKEDAQKRVPRRHHEAPSHDISTDISNLVPVPDVPSSPSAPRQLNVVFTPNSLVFTSSDGSKEMMLHLDQHGVQTLHNFEGTAYNAISEKISSDRKVLAGYRKRIQKKQESA